ncbi:SPP1 family predicted phage head-tail adaptor [Bradyrhizobium sp. cir1]|uniref:phage head closure protein n=1 Tax=Bradyrhizobium sp. cir1 TaxID=1445730 RepID=UPI001606A0A4|nr:phage head closure protein [Bradyrhizobium sp. cir1]MBB4373314.1 SPP1 family predicted phage head-tail adaptor [Bradyrhizobium sp. cir1]
MRAGNLDRIVEIQRRTTGLDLYGTPVETWTTFATMRAQLLKNATDGREGARGHTTDAVLTFRTRYLDGVTLENRLTYQGQQFEIIGVSEIGRRVGLDITCRRAGP